MFNKSLARLKAKTQMNRIGDERGLLQHKPMKPKRSLGESENLRLQKLKNLDKTD